MNHTNDIDSVDNDIRLKKPVENKYNFEGDQTTSTQEIDSVTKEKDKTHSYHSVQSDTIQQQD